MRNFNTCYFVSVVIKFWFLISRFMPSNKTHQNILLLPYWSLMRAERRLIRLSSCCIWRLNLISCVYQLRQLALCKQRAEGSSFWNLLILSWVQIYCLDEMLCFLWYGNFFPHSEIYTKHFSVCCVVCGSRYVVVDTLVLK